MTTTLQQLRQAPALRQATGTDWIVGQLGPYSVSAKAFKEPSEYGMPEEARISKLQIKLGNAVIYNFDRGLDIDRIAASTLRMVVKAVGKAIR